ncbi:MAG: lipoate--protein ligase family protein, partial [Gemmatimonadales bacterium]
FGRHEPALRRYDRARIEALGLDVVRRPTGGRAVWHAEELTYAVAMPRDAFGGLREAYGEIHGMLLDALRRLGISAELAPAREPVQVGAGACFASPAGGEILVGGRKAVGSAQLREGAGLLQHGSILLAGRQGLVHDLTLGDTAADRSGSLAEAVRSLPDPGRVARAVATAASLRWGGEWTDDEVARDLLDDAAAHEVRFRSLEWTWRA